jgi:hypothetical protein
MVYRAERFPAPVGHDRCEKRLDLLCCGQAYNHQLGNKGRNSVSWRITSDCTVLARSTSENNLVQSLLSSPYSALEILSRGHITIILARSCLFSTRTSRLFGVRHRHGLRNHCCAKRLRYTLSSMLLSWKRRFLTTHMPFMNLEALLVCTRRVALLL